MICPNCKGEQTVINGYGQKVRCFECNGTGEMCDGCGEASNVCDGSCMNEDEE